MTWDSAIFLMAMTALAFTSFSLGVRLGESFAPSQDKAPLDDVVVLVWKNDFPDWEAVIEVIRKENPKTVGEAREIISRFYVWQPPNDDRTNARQIAPVT
jgi:hypothetical protein